MQKISLPYTTVWTAAEAEFVERRSRFIGQIAPVSQEEQALDFIKKVSSHHWNAAHNVYAYILRENHISRYSDDGEPSGTAGMPMLEVLRREGVVDVVVVGTRYFGGVLLGAGGLVRAYAHTAKIALDAAKLKKMVMCADVSFLVDYDFYGKLMYLLPQYGGVVLSSDFTDKVSLYARFAMERLGPFDKALTEASGGKVHFSLSKSEYGCLDVTDSV